MDLVCDLDWFVQVVGRGLPGALAVFEPAETDLVLVAANDKYLRLFGEAAPAVGDVVGTILPGDDPQLDRVTAVALAGEGFSAESWTIPAPAGTYATGVAYTDWSLRPVEAFGRRALVLLLTDATPRAEREQELAETLVRLRGET